MQQLTHVMTTVKQSKFCCIISQNIHTATFVIKRDVSDHPVGGIITSHLLVILAVGKHVTWSQPRKRTCGVKWIIAGKSMADPGFPRQGCQPKGGATNLFIGHFPLKLHKKNLKMDKDGA